MDSEPRALPNKKWWIFFTDTSQHRNRWYHLIPSYKPPFRHVYAACEVANNIIMFIDPQMNGCAISIVTGRPTEHIRYVLMAGGRVLYCEMPDWHEHLDDLTLRFKRGWTITCASVIAYHMALDTRAQTPKGLFNLLRREHGAVELRRQVDERRREWSEQAPGAVAGRNA